MTKASLPGAIPSPLPRRGFVETREHERFSEFCDAVVRDRYIGVCVGPPGVGKTASAIRYSGWSLVEECFPRYVYDEEPPQRATILKTAFYTATVVSNPRSIEADVFARKNRMNWLVDAALRVEQQTNWDDSKWTSNQRKRFASVGTDHTKLLIVDEANRLKTLGFDQLRDMYDREGFGLILIGMPGIEKTLARYPQLYSRVGFVHHFGALTGKETKTIILQHRRKLGIGLSAKAFSGEDGEEALAAIARMSGGNLRLIQRLLQQVERIMRMNKLSMVDREVVDVARESLVIGAT